MNKNTSFFKSIFRLSPVSIVFIYFLVSIIWITWSDQIVGNIEVSALQRIFLETVKGWLFVLVTSLLLYRLIKRVTTTLQHQNEEMAEKAKALQQSELRFRNLFEQSPVGVFHARPGGGFIRVNAALVSLLGYATSEELLLSITNITEQLYIPGDDNATLFSRILDSRGWVSFEADYHHKDGSTSTGIITLRRILDAAGNTDYIEGFVQDITDRKRIETELKEQKSFFEQMFIQSATCTQILDKDGWCLRINPKLSSLFNVLPEHIEGHQYNIFLDGEIQKNGIDEILKKVYREKQSAIWDVDFDIGEAAKSVGVTIERYKRAWFSNKAYPILDDKGNLLNVIIQHEEITERKVVEEELRQSKEKAEEHSRLKSSFLANMSHELRTPMIGILGFSEILYDTSQDTGTLEIAAVINNSAKRLMETLNLILDLSRIEAGKLRLNLSMFNIADEIREVCKSFEQVACKKNLFLVFNPPVDSYEVYLDKKMFGGIINNLVNNAIKFTTTGGITIELTKESNSLGEQIVIRVRDTGIGIACENFETIFEEFRQTSEGIGRSFEGSGLGLTITKNFVEKLNGTIHVESELNAGSTFTIKFPIIIHAEDKTMQEQVVNQKTDYIKANYGENTHPEILYVEDDIVAFNVVSRMLQDICTIEGAENSEEALKKVELKQYTAILMDINLKSGMDGSQTTTLIRKLKGYENIPIIAVTAFAMVGDKEEFLKAGCSHYISKPFSKKEIVSLVSEVLAKK